MTWLRIVLETICVIATTVAAILVTRTGVRVVRLVRGCQPDHLRDGDRGRRLRAVARDVLRHTRLLDSPLVGAAHWLVMVGFAGLALQVPVAYAEIIDPQVRLPLVGGWGPYQFTVELLAAGTVAGILVLIVVRQVRHPRRAGRASRFSGSRQAHAYLVEAIVLVEGLAVVGITASPAPARPVLVPVLAAIKILAAVTFLVAVAAVPTMGVATHRLTALINLYFRRWPDGRPALGPARPALAGGRPMALADWDTDAVDLERFGTGTIDDLSWKTALDLLSCTECGRCQAACPAWTAGRPLSPKALILGAREQLLPGPARDVLCDPAALWSCTTCGACVASCPVGVEHLDLLLDLRRHQVLSLARFPDGLASCFRGLERRGNPWNQPQASALGWASGLDFPIPVLGGPGDRPSEPVEYVFWTGCAGAFDERAQQVTRATASLLRMAGVSFAVLGPGWVCCGDPARRSGNEWLFQELAAANIARLDEVFAGCDPQRAALVVNCPHCLNTLGNEYPEFGGRYRVLHHSQVLGDLVAAGRLTPVPGSDAGHAPAVTYHDPCYLGRHNGGYDPARALIRATGSRLREPAKAGPKASCCGAGGGQMWLAGEAASAIGAVRAAELQAGGTSTVISACPYCRIMLDDASGDLTVIDIAQLLLSTMSPVPGGTGDRLNNGRTTE